MNGIASVKKKLELEKEEAVKKAKEDMKVCTLIPVLSPITAEALSHTHTHVNCITFTTVSELFVIIHAGLNSPLI